MTRRGFLVISDLYKILGSYGVEDLREAASVRELAPGIREALYALIEEAERSTPYKEKKRRRLQSKGEGSSKELYQRFLECLLDEARFPTKQSVSDFAVELGLPKVVDPRASRERAARALAKKAMSSKRLRDRLANALAGEASDSQTAGWLKLILENGDQ